MFVHRLTLQLSDGGIVHHLANRLDEDGDHLFQVRIHQIGLVLVLCKLVTPPNKEYDTTLVVLLPGVIMQYRKSGERKHLQL